MRIALFSDVHANLPALEAVLRTLAGRDDIDATYHLGDLVGYAPWPDEVIERLRDAAIPGVAGNYDSAIAAHDTHCGCRHDDARQEALAHQAFDWTLAHTSDRSKRFLGWLPFRIDIRPRGGHVAGPTIRLVHGNQALNSVYVMEDCSDDTLATMGNTLGAGPGDIVCFGHTHRPWRRGVGGVHFVNVGSVGRPKDGDPRATCVLLDVAEETVGVEFVRVEYDVEATARAIVESGLPDEFAEYLRTGGALAHAFAHT